LNDKLIKIINGIFFYLVWIGSIVGVQSKLPYLGLLITIAFILFHLRIAHQFKREIYLMIFCVLLSIIVESLLLYFNIFYYKGYFLFESPMPPLWVISLWIALSLTTNYSMFFIKEKFYLAIFSGMLFGPWCYYICMKSKILYFNFSILETVLILGVVWGACLPILFYFNKKIGKVDGI
tara:strand:- start:2169 stop:2705 length:537 start_codon:yes stop_codon:yes gene_type:complete